MCLQPSSYLRQPSAKINRSLLLTTIATNRCFYLFLLHSFSIPFHWFISVAVLIKYICTYIHINVSWYVCMYVSSAVVAVWRVRCSPCFVGVFLLAWCCGPFHQFVSSSNIQLRFFIRRDSFVCYKTRFITIKNLLWNKKLKLFSLVSSYSPFLFL